MSSPTALAASLIRGPLVGTFLGLILYGVTCMQTFFYFRTYEQDSRNIKMTVLGLLVLDTAHAVMTMWVLDDYLIVHYGDMEALDSATWSYMATYILGLLIDFYVYLYFTWRIWIFTKSIWIAVLMSAISISRTAISILVTTLSVLKPTWNNYLASARTLLLIGNMLFIAGDTFSATIMAFHLTRFKSWAHEHELPQSRPRRIDVLLNRLLVFAVATGALTSLVDVLALVLMLAQPQSLTFLSAVLVQTRLYVNSLLASLNVRNATQRAYQDANSTSRPAVSIHFARPVAVRGNGGGRGRGAEELSSIDTEDAGYGRLHDASKDHASWQATHVQSRTSPQV